MGCPLYSVSGRIEKVIKVDKYNLYKTSPEIQDENSGTLQKMKA
jgi:hypothetical protein